MRSSRKLTRLFAPVLGGVCFGFADGLRRSWAGLYWVFEVFAAVSPVVDNLVDNYENKLFTLCSRGVDNFCYYQLPTEEQTELLTTHDISNLLIFKLLQTLLTEKPPLCYCYKLIY